MRKILALVVLLISLIAVFMLTRQDKVLEPQDKNVLSRETQVGREIEISGNVYRVVWAKVNTEDLSLIPNFEMKLTSKNILIDEDCKVLTSAGFYSKDSSPIGYFVSNRQELSAFTENSLFDGVLSINQLATPRITREVPKDPLVDAVQTGPIVFENGKPRELSFIRDYSARRVLAAVTGSNELIFLVFYLPDSEFLGPMLSQLPELTGKLNSEENLSIADAINLDGGSASTFAITDFSLSEASPVGAFFCAK